jgi:type IV secretory pathway TrbF-like protein
MAVADMSDDQGFQVCEFMIGYISMNDVIAADKAGTLADLGIPDYDSYQTNMDIMDLLGHFTASHWMDSSLVDQFYLKGYNWLGGEPGQDWIDQRSVE